MLEGDAPPTSVASRCHAGHQLAANGSDGGDGGGDGEEPSLVEEPSLGEDEETDGEADAEAGVNEEEDV
mgnify:CR=1 FL=1